MAFTLSNLLQNIYGDLGQSETFLATGGSTTTAINTVKASLDSPPDDNYCKEGALFVVRDGAGASAAPEGEFGRISLYDSATQTYTVDTALTAVIAATDTIMVATGLFPLREMIRCCNRALQSIGRIELWDESLTMSADTHEYTLPIATKGRRLVAVYRQSSTTTNDNDWVPLGGWKVKPATAGSTETLWIQEEESGYKLGLVYRGTHPNLTAYSSVVSEKFPEELVTQAAILEAMKWYLSASGGGSDFWTQRYNMAQQQYDEARKSFRYDTHGTQPKYLVY